MEKGITLKEKVFQTIEEQIPLKEFEQWLYQQSDLLEKMSNDLILELFEFNYNQKGAHYEFKKSFVKYFDENEFMLWKIKANLRDLIAGKETKDRILHEFYYDLGYGEYPFVQRIGYYLFEFEELEYSTRTLPDLLSDLKSDAEELLNEIELQEKLISDFRIKSFVRKERQMALPTVEVKRQWWKFWYN